MAFGVVKVLSTASITCFSAAQAAMPVRSATRNVGFDTASIKIIFVLGRRAAATHSACVVSTKLVSIPNLGKSSFKRRSERP